MTRLAIAFALFFAPLALAQTDAEKAETVKYLHKLQIKRGGFKPALAADTPTLRATSAALRALKLFGGTSELAKENKLFVAICKDKSGGYADTPGGKPGPVVTAVGLMAAIEVGILSKPADKAGATITYLENSAKEFEDIRMAAAGLEAIGKKSKKNDDWIDAVLKMQNDDGTFSKGAGKARDTGGAAACILRLGGKLKDTKAVLKALDAGQREDGAFGNAEAKGSDLETTYRVMRCYHMLGKQPPKPDAVRKFVAKCRNKNGGYGVKPDVASSASATYFAGSILKWLGEK
jgi:hypothetical protein